MEQPIPIAADSDPGTKEWWWPIPGLDMAWRWCGLYMPIEKGVPLRKGLVIMESLFGPMLHIIGLSSSFTAQVGEPEPSRANMSGGSVLIFSSSWEWLFFTCRVRWSFLPKR